MNSTMKGFSKKLDTQAEQSKKNKEKQETLNENLTSLTNTFTNFQQTFHTSNKNLETKINGLECEFGKLQDTVENSAAKTTEEVKASIIP